MGALLGKLLGGFKSKLGYMVLSYVVSALLGSLKSAHPDWTLPTPEEILGLGALAVSGHIVTDVVAIAKGLGTGENLSQIATDLVRTVEAQPGAPEAIASAKG